MYRKALDVFKAAAEYGSFSKAAERLYITHTAVIKQINQLEADLGVTLFVRSRQGVRLTPAGQGFYEDTLRIMQFSEAAIRRAQALQRSAPRIIRIGTSLLFPCGAFMQLWEKISDCYPQFQLKMIPFEDSANTFFTLGEHFDFVIGAHNSLLSRNFCQFIPLGRYHLYVCMARKHRLAKRSILCWDDLAHEHLMLMKHGNSPVIDQLRRDLTESHPDIFLEDISYHYDAKTFNECAERGCVLLSLECWQNVHPALVTIPLQTKRTLPYGIISSAHPSADMAQFLEIMRDTLSTV